MEILWAALGICALVVFIFWVLAQHWQRLLRHQTWALRRLADRVRMLEEVENPEFRRRVNESAPPPLEQVFTFTLHLDERFWNETLHMAKEDREFIKAFGSFLGSVKIEQWRGHSVATITEVLPEGKSPAWQARSLHCYFDGDANGDRLTLWEIPLARVRGLAKQPSSLELVLKGKSLELCAHLFSFSEGENEPVQPGQDELVFFHIPLSSAQLAEFLSHDPLTSANGTGASGPDEISPNQNSLRAYYSHQDDEIGFEWQLWVRDLTKKVEWDRWRILESVASPVVEEIRKQVRRVRVPVSVGRSNRKTRPDIY